MYIMHAGFSVKFSVSITCTPPFFLNAKINKEKRRSMYYT